MQSALKWHGGKHYLASKIVAIMPPHIHYVEPYAGGLSVLLAKNPDGVSEVVNDLNLDLSIFWRVLSSESHFAKFKRIVEAIPVSEVEFNNPIPDDERFTSAELSAARFFIRCRQSMAGRMKGFTPLSRTRTRRGMNEQASAWLTAIEGLPEIHARLRRVVVLNRDALDVIRQQDGLDTLFYLDPPYLHETRATVGEYTHEMTADDHRLLLMRLNVIKGRFLLSGYRSELYDEWAFQSNFQRHDFELPNNAAGGDSKRRMIESIWCNFTGSEDNA